MMEVRIVRTLSLQFEYVFLSQFRIAHYALLRRSYKGVSTSFTRHVSAWLHD